MREAGQKRNKVVCVWRGADEREGERGFLEGSEEKEGGLEAVFPLGPGETSEGRKKTIFKKFCCGL